MTKQCEIENCATTPATFWVFVQLSRGKQILYVCQGCIETGLKGKRIFTGEEIIAVESCRDVA